MKIERDVPIPPKGNRGPRTALSKLIREMNVGECLALDSENEWERARYIMCSIGWRCIVRRGDLNGKKWRIWRAS